MLRSALVAIALVLAAPASAAPEAQAADPLYIVDDYYPDHDAAADLAAAVTRAREENKRILIVVGGEWCVWCHILDRFIAANADVHDAFAQSFVMLKVNYSDDNENTAFLSAFPQSTGYPDFMILDSDGRFLAQQETSVLEQGRSYNRARMLAFASVWRAR